MFAIDHETLGDMKALLLVYVCLETAIRKNPEIGHLNGTVCHSLSEMINLL